ncbi:MAG: SGNH/GDSL hydrolase family protein [Bacilli bacterium]|jgi:bacillolysin|nr:SGNH/GDSL hydrolase family protein [Bacilli bacterium]
MKKVIILVLIIILPIIIYIINLDKKIYYLALGDSLALGQNPYNQIGYGYSDYIYDYLKEKKLLEFYIKEYAVSGYRTIDLIRDIKDNKKIIKDNREIAIKNALTNADIVTLSIGINDILYKINNLNVTLINKESILKYIDEVLVDFEELIILLKKYCKEDIILLNYYFPPWIINNSDNKDLVLIFQYTNKKIKNIAKHNNIYYVDIAKNLNNINYFPNPIDVHPSIHGYEIIADQIIKLIEEKIL